MFELEDYITIIKSVLAFILIFYAAYMGGSLAVLCQYLRTQIIYDEQWRKLSEFPITHHACHVIRYFYTTSLVIGLCFLPVFAYVIFNFGLAAFFLLFFTAILGIVSAVCTYIVGLFNQVYLIMIAVEIFKGMRNQDEQFTSQILHTRHLEKKKNMRNFYICLLVRDFIIVPISYLLDLDQISRSTPFSISTAVTMLTSTSIFLSVPLAVITYLIKNSENRTTKNELQNMIFAQAVVSSVAVMIVLAIFLVLFFFGWFSVFFLSFAIQSTGFIVPLNIMITTVVHCKSINQRNFTAVVNLGRVQPLVVPIENLRNLQYANSSNV
ncbi:Protein CBG17008 [Caenorhabditis briggsae]|uniref:Protein CBG17008 n=1 Tax=Caenorhabditis briggsae TaxID=6238 RepID=A8XQ91_CAEBR|nr:Protein CBG17008 [Caenorhabditis briggsae]CAP34817.1 Protein CBG17008 [Caenorhabditis briggsae]